MDWTKDKYNVRENKRGLEGKSFSYRWEDGWSVVIQCRKITALEARKYRVLEQRNKFCGYEWMVDSIMEFGEILTADAPVKQAAYL